MYFTVNKEKLKQSIENEQKTKKHTIMIVDDEPGNVESISKILREEYNVIQMNNGMEALTALEEADGPKIDLILSDQRMPNMNGVEFLRRTIPISPLTVRIILTGFIDINDIIDAVNDGHIYNFLIKPIEPTELLTSIRRALEAYEMEVKNIALIEELKRINETLEDKVQERTRELKNMNEELQIKNFELQKLQSEIIQRKNLASIGQLAAGVAHELNNPISFIYGNFDVLKRYINSILKYIEISDENDKENYKAKKYYEENDISYIINDILELLNESKDGIDRVVKIVKALRDFSRIDAEDIEEYSINKGIEDTLIVSKNEYKYVAEMEKDLKDVPIIWVNGRELNEVLLNIIVNAGQAITEKKYDSMKKIKVSTYKEDDNVVCIIEDNGPGIPEEIIDKIFEPFFTTKEPGKGTGLGLNIAYNIILKYKGEIKVDSQIGIGTKFTIKLPIS